MTVSDAATRRPEPSTAGPLEAPLAISRRQFAAALGISERSVDDWAKMGRIRVVRLGRRTLIPTSELERILAGH